MSSQQQSLDWKQQRLDAQQHRVDQSDGIDGVQYETLKRAGILGINLFVVAGVGVDDAELPAVTSARPLFASGSRNTRIVPGRTRLGSTSCSPPRNWPAAI